MSLFSSFPVAADPDVPLIIHSDTVKRAGPFVARPRATPVPNQVSSLIKLEHRRCRHTAIRGWWFPGLVDFFGLWRVIAVNDPNIVVRVGGHPDGHAQHPMIRERLGP